MIKRTDDWLIRLHEAVEAQRHDQFAWGERDCALFAADCVLAMTGTDPAKGFRGRYKTSQGAALALKRAGHMTLADMASSVLTGIPVALASTGDVAAWEDDGNLVLGVFIGERVMGRMTHGLGTVDRSVVTMAWRVPA